MGSVFALDEPRSQLVEAVAVRAARVEERAVEAREQETVQRIMERPSIGKAFARFLDLLAHFRSPLAIDRQSDHYDSLHVPVHS